MLSVLTHPAYRRLFSAQIVALVGTGLLTIALGLLAFDLAGDAAGTVLGTAFAIKMIAYVGLAPLAQALAARLPRKAVLIGADLVRAGVALSLPFIDSVWQIYLLIFVLQAASATFTPAFQAVIPDILTDERDYTRALSLSRLAYDLENILSPAIAGVLLLFIAYSGLFVGTTIGFLASSLLVLITPLPPRSSAEGQRPFRERLTRGIRIYLATPRLRGLLALNMAAAAAGAFVLVNSVVMVRGQYGFDDAGLAVAMGAFGAGSMATALILPRLLDRLDDRPVMVAAGLALGGLTLAHGLHLATSGLLAWGGFLMAWALSGALYSAVLTPSGRLLRLSAHAQDRPALFAAQFALSHACWLITYPLAGWLGAVAGLPFTMAVLGVIALASATAAIRIWPQGDRGPLVHSHDDLPSDHPHLREHGGRRRHAHVYVIDDEHHAWPTQG